MGEGEGVIGAATCEGAAEWCGDAGDCEETEDRRRGRGTGLLPR